MENYFALAKAGVVNWVIEAAFLRVATMGRKKKVKGVQKPRGFSVCWFFCVPKFSAEFL